MQGLCEFLPWSPGAALTLSRGRHVAETWKGFQSIVSPASSTACVRLAAPHSPHLIGRASVLQTLLFPKPRCGVLSVQLWVAFGAMDLR